MAAIKDYIGVVCHLGWNYGFIARGESEKENIYFHKSKVVAGLFDSIHIDDIVMCDAQIVTNQSSKYKATTVALQNDRCLYNCIGIVSKLDKSVGHIKLNEPDTRVQFSHSDFYSENELRVDCIEKFLKIGDLVYCDAVESPSGGREWRATRVWTKPPQTSENLTINKHGRVLNVSKREGLISFGSDTFSERIFFSIDAFYENKKQIDDLTSVLRKFTPVDVEAKTWAAETAEEVKCKWIATCVWTGNRPKFDKTSSVLCNVEGIIVKVLAQGAIFRFAHQSRDKIVHFEVNDFYDDGKKVLNLEWCLKVGDKVNFDAMLDEENTKWRAVVVWKGGKPNYTSIIDKMKRVEQYLQKNCPLIKCNDKDKGDVPIVTVSSEILGDGTSETAENDLQLTVNQDVENVEVPRREIVDSGKLEDQAVEVSKCQIILKKIDSLAEELCLKDGLQNGDVEDGKNCEINLLEDSFCTNFERLMEHVTTIADKWDKGNSNIECSQGDDFKGIVESGNCSSSPEVKEASTQTVFTGEIFCSHVFIEP